MLLKTTADRNIRIITAPLRSNRETAASEKYALTPYDGDTFYEPLSGTGVYFTFGSDGKVQSVKVTMLDLPGRTGVFTRV
ncbi:hypothetical protein [Methanocorpusculum sp.]